MRSPAIGGKIVWNADKPDGAMMKVLDVSRMKQALDGWAPPTGLKAGPGQDDRLVPGQQGPGGCQMVNRRHWYRHDVPPGTRDQRAVEPAQAARPAGSAIDPGDEPVPLAPRRLGPRLRETAGGKRILFINQYYWPDHASTAQHLTDLAESLADQGYECHVLALAGPLQAGRAPAAGVRDSRRGSYPPRPGDLAGPSRHLGPDDRLPELLRRGHGQGHAPAPLRRGRHPHDSADHRPGRHALEAAQEDAARLLEHGPPSRRQPGARADVAARACSAGSCTG